MFTLYLYHLRNSGSVSSCFYTEEVSYLNFVVNMNSYCKKYIGTFYASFLILKTEWLDEKYSKLQLNRSLDGGVSPLCLLGQVCCCWKELFGCWLCWEVKLRAEVASSSCDRAKIASPSWNILLSASWIVSGLQTLGRGRSVLSS